MYNSSQMGRLQTLREQPAMKRYKGGLMNNITNFFGMPKKNNDELWMQNKWMNNMYKPSPRHYGDFFNG